MTEILELETDLPNGARAHYATAGSGDDVVVLLHGGLPGSSGAAGWRLMLPALAESGLRVIAPDRPGFGQADTRAVHHPTRGFLDWTDHVHQLTLALGIDRFHLGGNSQGAQIAAYYAVNHFDRVRSLCFIATAGLSAALGIPAQSLTPGSLPPRFDGTPGSMRATLEHIVRRKEHLTDDLIASRTAAALAQQDAYARGSQAIGEAFDSPDMRQWMSIGDRLPQLSIPAIYLHGRQDVLNPLGNAFEQEDRLPNVQFFYPDDCGHQGQTDQPEIFARVMSEFFTTGEVSAEAAQLAGVSDRRPTSAVVAHA